MRPAQALGMTVWLVSLGWTVFSGRLRDDSQVGLSMALGMVAIVAIVWVALVVARASSEFVGGY